MPLLKLFDYSLVKFLRALKNLRVFRALKTFKDICGKNTHNIIYQQIEDHR